MSKYKLKWHNILNSNAINETKEVVIMAKLIWVILVNSDIPDKKQKKASIQDI